MPLQSAGKVLRLLSNLKEKYTTVDRHKICSQLHYTVDIK